MVALGRGRVLYRLRDQAGPPARPRPAERKAPGVEDGQVTCNAFFGIAVKKLAAGVVLNTCDHRHFGDSADCDFCDR